MCTLEKCSGVYVLTLTGDDEHRLNPTQIAVLGSALSRIKSELSSDDSSSAGVALVTTAQGKYFSNGYDVAWAYNTSPYSPATTKRRAIQMSKALRKLVLDLISLPIPTIAALTGHAAAAGLILALSHDYVVMRSDRGFMYMSELDLGMRIPRWFMALLRSKITQPADRRDLLLAASRVGAKRAMEMGVVDEAYEGAAETVAGAMRLAEDVGAMGTGKAYGESRKVMLGEMIDVIGFDETVEGEAQLPGQLPGQPPGGRNVSRL